MVIDYQQFIEQLEIILTDRNYLMLLAFDLFDTNLDQKISELDLYKVYMCFHESSYQGEFMDLLYPDMIKLIKTINEFAEVKKEKMAAANQGNQRFVDRLQDFRNLQNIDPNFIKRKEKVLWPIFDFNLQRNPSKSSTLLNKNQFDSTNKNYYRRLYNSKIDSLESVRKIKESKPLLSGFPDTNVNDSFDLDFQAMERQLNKSRTESSSSGDSEADMKKKMNDVFEGSAYWQLEQTKKENARALQRNQAIKEARRQQIGQNSVAAYYASQKAQIK